MGGVIHATFSPIWDGAATTGNILAAGQQRSGKSNLTRVIAKQLAEGDIADVAFLDAKGGEGIGRLDGLRNQIGPLALTADDVRNALFTIIMEMLRRYAVMREERLEVYPGKPLVVFFSEFGTYRKDEAIMYMLWRLLAQGPAASIHMVLDTQSPRSDQFGDFAEAKNQLDRIFVYRTANQHDTVHIIPPGLDLNAYALMRPGDGYMVGRSIGKRRFMTAFVDPYGMDKLQGRSPHYQAWQFYCAEQLYELDTASAPQAAGRPVQEYTLEQMAVMVWALTNRETMRHMPGDWRNNVRDILQEATGNGMSQRRIAELRNQAETVMALAMNYTTKTPALEDKQ